MSTKAPSNPFAVLTWDDIEAWAGSTIVSRGKSYRRSNRVQKLARTASGGIVTWVQGTSRYATQVEITKKKLTASCICPYGGNCKIVVAVALSYLECLKNQKEIPTAVEDDSLNGQRGFGAGNRRESRRFWRSAKFAKVESGLRLF